MTTPTKARPTAKPKAPAKPKPQSPSPKVPADIPEVDKAPAPVKARGGNSAYAAETVRNQIADALTRLWAQGWTRPAVSKITGFSDSQVWRAANRKVHEAEVPVLMDFLKAVLDGKHQPPAKARKPKVEDLQAKIDAAVKALGDEAKTVAQLRKVVEAARAALTA